MKRKDSMDIMDEAFEEKVNAFNLNSILPGADEHDHEEQQQDGGYKRSGITELIAIHEEEETVPDTSWSCTKLGFKNFVHSGTFDGIAAIFIFLNCVLVIIETDNEADCKSNGKPNCDEGQGWLKAMSVALLVIFCIEILLRMLAAGEAYFKIPWNWFDLMIIAVGIVCEIAGNLFSFMVYIRVLRIVRLFRTVRILVAFRELYIIMHGMMCTLRAIGWAAVLMAALLVMWSVFAVEMLHEYNLEMPYDEEECPGCKYALSSVWQASVTLFQTVVIGDDWGAILIPLVNAHPWTSVIFLGLHFTVAIGLVNLILAAIVDKAAEAREEDIKAITACREQKQRAAKRSLVKLCVEMDVDKSGSLTLLELLDGFNHSQGFRSVLDVLDVDKEDLECVFRIMDQDKSGDVSYCEFVDLLYRMKTQNSKTLLMFIKHYVLELRGDVAQQLGLLKGEIMTNLKQNRKDTAILQRSLSMHTPDTNFEIVELEESIKEEDCEETATDATNLSAVNSDKQVVEVTELPGVVSSSSEIQKDAGKTTDGASSAQKKSAFRKGRTQQFRKRGLRHSKTMPAEAEAHDEQDDVQAGDPASSQVPHVDIVARAENTQLSETLAPGTEMVTRSFGVPPIPLSLGVSAVTDKWSLREELDRLAQDIEVQLAAAALRAEQQHAVLLQKLCSAAAVAAEGAGSSFPAGAAIATASSVVGSTGSSTGGSAEDKCTEEIGSDDQATAEHLWNMAYPSNADQT